MKPLTPIDAQRSLSHAEAHDNYMAVGHRRALETIAGMREEWGIVATYMGRHEVEEWGFDTREEAKAKGDTFLSTEYRIVRRYVTEPEEA